MTTPRGMSDFLAAVVTADHVQPFNESTRSALDGALEFRVFAFDEVVAAAATGDEPVEFVVHPRYRRQGRGRALLNQLTSEGEQRFWAHGDLPGARALAESADLVAIRTLLVLRQSQRPAALDVPADLIIRPFTEDDVDAIIAINAAAFADHPEQGAMDRADFDRRRDQSWFEPAGLFVAERNGRVVGFHWTKIEDNNGEVYVVGVDPAAHGGGVGSALTDVGVQWLWDDGADHVDLYVEGDNAPALAVYRRLGFVEHSRDTLYESR